MVIRLTQVLDPGKIAQSGQCFRCRARDSGYRFIHGAHVLDIAPIAPDTFEVSCDKETWRDVWAPYFDLGRDYSRIRERDARGFLAKAIAEGRGLRVLRQDPWETLISFILSQRKSIPAIRSCTRALCAAFGERVEAHGEAERLFPTPEALLRASDEDLSACALGYRAPYVRDAARRVSAEPNLLARWAALDDDALLEALMTIRGVGVKVARCVMLFAYGRTASVPVDTWIRRVIEDVYAGEDPFSPYGEDAGIVQQYVFYYVLRHKRDLRSKEV